MARPRGFEGEPIRPDVGLAPLDGTPLRGRSALEEQDGGVGRQPQRLGDVARCALGNHALGAAVDRNTETLKFGVQSCVREIALE